MASGINLGLERVTSLLTSLPGPRHSFPIVHIAGTNGKGSISAYLDSALTASGLRTGRFNSPHLIDEHDAVRLAGEPVDPDVFRTARERVREANRTGSIGASEFEVLAVTAMECFARAEPAVDMAVVEVGLGGRLDATNAFAGDRLAAAVIAPIDLDHQALLGGDVAAIAREKAGIIKHCGGPVILAQQAHREAAEVVRAVAAKEKVPVYEVPPLSPIATDADGRTLLPFPGDSSRTIAARLPLPGAHQAQNALTALHTLERLRNSSPLLSRISDGDIIAGFEHARWPGRLDTVVLPSKRSVLVDGAHNPAAAIALRAYLDSRGTAPTVWVLGFSRGKDLGEMMRVLLRETDAVVGVGFSEVAGMPWVKPVDPDEISTAARGVLGDQAAVRAEGHGTGLKEALDWAEATGHSVVVAGSLYLAADVYRLARGDSI